MSQYIDTTTELYLFLQAKFGGRAQSLYVACTDEEIYDVSTLLATEKSDLKELGFKIGDITRMQQDRGQQDGAIGSSNIGPNGQLEYLKQCIGGTSDEDMKNDIEKAMKALAKLAEEKSRMGMAGADVPKDKLQNLLDSILSSSLTGLPTVMTATMACLVDKVSWLQGAVAVQALLAFINMAQSAYNLWHTLDYLKRMNLSGYRDKQATFISRMMDIAAKISQSHTEYTHGTKLKYTFTYLAIELQSLRGDIMSHVRDLQWEKNKLERMAKETRSDAEKAYFGTVVSAAAVGVTLAVAPPLGAVLTTAAVATPVMYAVSTGLKFCELGAIQKYLPRVDELLRTAKQLETEIDRHIAAFDAKIQEMNKQLEMKMRATTL